jgi:hypothetical protein
MRRLETSILKKSNHIRIAEELEEGVLIRGLAGDILAYCEMS